MPGLNGTGPMGRGPMTGRGLGYCNPAYNQTTSEAPERVPPMPRQDVAGTPFYGVGRGGMPRGGGRGRCFGGGRRMGRRFW